jgi:signal transduction histidine kinase
VVRRHEALIDAAVPVLVGAVILAGELLHGGRSAQPAALALGLGASAVLSLRRRAPVATLALSGALVGLLFYIDGSAATVAVLAPAVALYSLGLTRGRRAQIAAGLVAVAAVLLADLLHSGRPGIVQTLGHLALVAIPLLAAEQVRTHRSYFQLLTERLRLAEEARELEAERRAEQERLRITREVHDVVAHTLTEINVEAGGAASGLGSGKARDALERIEEASHKAIGELRAILGVLRDSSASPAPRAPAPGIGDIAALVERSRQTGLDAELEVQGDPPAGLSELTSLATYRIVQESLTNARRHAPGARARIDLSYRPADLQVTIENDPSARANGGGGSPGVGIPGMRERATILGGTLEAGPTAQGFRVRASLPYQPGE